MSHNFLKRNMKGRDPLILPSFRIPWDFPAHAWGRFPIESFGFVSCRDLCGAFSEDATTEEILRQARLAAREAAHRLATKKPNAYITLTRLISSLSQVSTWDFWISALEVVFIIFCRWDFCDSVRMGVRLWPFWLPPMAWSQGLGSSRWAWAFSQGNSHMEPHKSKSQKRTRKTMQEQVSSWSGSQVVVGLNLNSI